MAVVTGVRTVGGVVVISSDGLVLTRVRRSDFMKMPLEEGDKFDPDEYLDKIAAMQFKEAYAAVTALLEGSDKTKAELKKMLTRKGFVGPAADAAVEKAAGQRFVDDKRYAERLVERNADTDKGIYALKRKMYRKGLSEEDIGEALSAIDDGQQKTACRRAYEKIRKRYEGLPKREARAKLSRALASRGFGWDTISAVLEDDPDEEDYDL
ncbi:MAG: RecX family transcriptional regulator [Clostridia bacterium]|nr:RecX family transcriptional regulator [Clostridia bacterium]